MSHVKSGTHAHEYDRAMNMVEQTPGVSPSEECADCGFDRQLGHKMADGANKITTNTLSAPSTT